jgi:hypothetical protein
MLQEEPCNRGEADAVGAAAAAPPRGLHAPVLMRPALLLLRRRDRKGVLHLQDALLFRQRTTRCIFRGRSMLPHIMRISMAHAHSLHLAL